jgi:hypothetical protein
MSPRTSSLRQETTGPRRPAGAGAVRRVLVLAVGALLACSSTARADDWWPEGYYDQAPGSTPDPYRDIHQMEVPFFWDTAEPATVASVAFIRFYQTTLSRLRTGACPFFPSCSRYGLRAVHDHGAVWGWLMTLDRIFFRENRDMFHNYPWVNTELDASLFDPPAADYIWRELPWPLLTNPSPRSW